MAQYNIVQNDYLMAKIGRFDEETHAINIQNAKFRKSSKLIRIVPEDFRIFYTATIIRLELT